MCLAPHFEIAIAFEYLATLTLLLTLLHLSLCDQTAWWRWRRVCCRHPPWRMAPTPATTPARRCVEKGVSCRTGPQRVMCRAERDVVQGRKG